MKARNRSTLVLLARSILFLVCVTAIWAQTVVVVEVPNSVSTSVCCINNRGDVAGSFVDNTGKTHGFIRDRNANYTVFDAPTAPEIFSINNAGDVAGNFWVTGEWYGARGFVRDN